MRRHSYQCWGQPCSRSTGGRPGRPPRGARAAVRPAARTSMSRCSTPSTCGCTVPHLRHHAARCASTSSTPRPTRRRTTARSAPRWRARGRRGELVTSRFAYGDVPRRRGLRGAASASTGAARAPGLARGARAAKLAQHVPDMLRYRRAARGGRRRALPVADRAAARRAPAAARRARSCSPRTTCCRASRGRGQRAAQRRLYERVDAVVVHSEHGRARLRDELGVDPARVHVIPHGAFDHLDAAARRGAAAAGAREREGPVVLFFGLLRPYKGIDVLLEAWRGRRRTPSCGSSACRGWTLGRCAAARRPACASSPRFVADAELAGVLRRADLVVLPYREIDQSGVLFTALAFGKPLLLSDVGGFPEVAATGAAELVPPGDPAALRAALRRAARRPGARAALGARARARPRPRPYSWDADRARATSSSTSAAATRDGPRDRAGDRLLGLRRRCSSTRRPATASLLARRSAAAAPRPAPRAGRRRRAADACR